MWIRKSAYSAAIIFTEYYVRTFQVLQLTELLKRGIGIHHSGILPILKVKHSKQFFCRWTLALFKTKSTLSKSGFFPSSSRIFRICVQCCGSVTFWYGSGSPDLYH
jgi:superfamily II RNA helicase